MKIDSSTIVTDLKGSPIKVKPDEDLTLGEVMIAALVNTVDGDQTQGGSDKFNLYKLALKCSGVSDFTIDEINLIKTRIGKAWNTIVVGRAWDLLEASASSSA